MKNNGMCFALVLLITLVSVAFGIRSIGTTGSRLSGTAMMVVGPIISDTNWTEANSPYIVTSSVSVSEGVTLKIEPGVVVKFNASKGLQVDGQLVARGTEDKPVIFTSIRDDAFGGDSNGDGSLTSPEPGDWAYVFFTNSSADATFDADGGYIGGSILENCKITFGGSAGTQGSLQFNSSAPFVNYTTVCNSAKSGIYIGESTPKIVNSSISHNVVDGLSIVDLPSGKEITIIGNNVTNNLGDGINWYYSYYFYYGITGTVILANNSIDNNSGRGINFNFYYVNATAIITNNTITNNGGCGIYFGQTGESTITGNVVRSNSQGGIIIDGPNTAITNNVVIYNSAGYYWGDSAAIQLSGGYNTLQTVANNIVAYNTAQGKGALWLSSSPYSNLTVSDNSIVANVVAVNSIVQISCDSNDTFTRNLITQNRRSNSTVSSSLEVSGFPIVNYNNLFNNFYTYEINNTNGVSPSHVNARNNWWGTSNATEIQAEIYDWSDDVTKGIVDYVPYSTSIRTDAPISPPLNFTLRPGAANYTLSWNPNSEPDLAGYKIYYDTDSEYPYKYCVDVGNVNTYTLTDLSPKPIFFTVAAYDIDADGSNDMFEGHESWHAVEAIADYDPPIIETPSRTPAGDVQTYQPVNVSVIVTDDESGVKNVTLFYTTDNGATWTSLPINHTVSTNLYEWTIPGQWYWPTIVSYRIIAYDYAGNNATKEGTEAYTYMVLPEFSSLAITLLSMIATLLAVIIHRKHQLKFQTREK